MLFEDPTAYLWPLHGNHKENPLTQTELRDKIVPIVKVPKLQPPRLRAKASASHFQQRNQKIDVGLGVPSPAGDMHRPASLLS